MSCGLAPGAVRRQRGSRQVRALKTILIGLGVLFLVVVALFTWSGVSSSQFREEQAPFVEAFVIDLSKRWDIADVHGRMTNPFIEETSTPQAQQLLHQFKRLRALKSTQDVKLIAYKSYNDEQTGLFPSRGYSRPARP